MFLQLILYLFVLPLIQGSVYLYNTHNSSSVELYDCITDLHLSYCRRSSEPIALRRDKTTWYCDHEGISHNFSSLYLKNVSVSTVLHQWSSSIEKAEDYSRYIAQRRINETIGSDEKYLCECINPQSFGKHCEYLLPMGTTFNQTISWEIEMQANNIWHMQRYSDIVCYTTLICNSGLLCLDWRDVCDGIQHCMYGYDEENCDKLEFNECEDDEYRCMNGMCIADEYFLDGEYDCADTTDEKELFDDTKCTFQPATYECDDRMCLRSQWSCGDGQCLKYPFSFQYSSYFIQCNSLREQYHMCETHVYRAQWTLPNGKCYGSYDYKEIIKYDRTDKEECLYFVKCALSAGIEENCPCKGNMSCINKLKNPCSSNTIQYPNGAIIAPYLLSSYNTMRDWSKRRPDRIDVYGTIKCRKYMFDHYFIIKFESYINLQRLESELCGSRLNKSALSNNSYNEFCYKDSRTFNNRSYRFIDICKESKQCISAYRINDGYKDCAYGEDETKELQYSNTCSNIQRHRFRCSNEQPTCLFANKLGDINDDCLNRADTSWMRTGIQLSELICNTQSRENCEFIRQYIEASSKIDPKDGSDQQLELPKIPFRTFCDSFWNWRTKADENIQMCHKWWRCPDNQWQCRSGQCINVDWVLDGEWDCVDASDEEALDFPYNKFFHRNSNLISREDLLLLKIKLYTTRTFSTICNFAVEYPCFRANVSDPLNVTHNRPCISLSQIGDDHIDCLGGLDERNNLKHCFLPTMLGYYYQCSSSNVCISYFSHCSAKCPNDHVQCFGYQQTSRCSEKSDFMCLNGRCIKDGWCDGIFSCLHGEDELFCVSRKGTFDRNIFLQYRQSKALPIRITKEKLQLPRIPIDTNESRVPTTTILGRHDEASVINFFNVINSTIPYYCNRGIGVQLYNGSIACFCPPQYYGDRCQFHNDRIVFVFHLNLSRSIYIESYNPKTILKLLIIFLYNDQILMSESFQIKVIDEIIAPRKKILYLFYSRSNASLKHKQSRYFNRSNIINEHPYSIRIEAYELNLFETARLVGVWLYLIYFDFLPSFRLSKVLHLTKSDDIKNPCFSNPCNSQQKCYQILNRKSKYVCLCAPNFKGPNCSSINEMCIKGFCSINSLCKPNYRGILIGNELPYCICPLKEIGQRCGLIFDRCDPNSCQHNGTCLSTPSPSRFICLCDDLYYGDQCQLKKRSVQLYIEKSPFHRAAVVQYFDINFITLDLLLVDQQVYDNLPNLVQYLYIRNTAPSIIIIKFYSGNEYNIYLISIQISVESIYGSIKLNEINHCVDVQKLFPTNEEINPIKYHELCIQSPSLLCFVDNSYLCICEKNHSRVECFGYDHNLDQCPFCLSGGQCIKENRWRSKFLCLCPRCYSGKTCEFTSEYFSFTVDQLFSIDFSSKGPIKKQIVVILLNSVLWFLFLIGLLNNISSFVTFRRPKCLKNGIGHYLLWMSIINQINLTFLALRFTHLTLTTTSFRSDPFIDRIFCKILNYLLISSGRILYWFASLIAIERVYITIFIRGQWLKKPHIAKRLLMIIFSLVLVSGSYEIYFVESYKDLDTKNEAVCTLNFPYSQQLWTNIHKTVTVIHTLMPFFINICSTTTICYVITKKKMKINAKTIYIHSTNILQLKSALQKQQKQIIKTSQGNTEQKDDQITKLSAVKKTNRLLLFRDVLIENKELILGPGITLIPQLFSLPILIISIAFACQDIETNSIRYLLIISYLTSFIPQLISFLLYIFPSSFYTQEWHLTKLSKWFKNFCRQDTPTTTTNNIK